jgi:DNA-binding NarL/FixJ family response regulator
MKVGRQIHVGIVDADSLRRRGTVALLSKLESIRIAGFAGNIAEVLGRITNSSEILIVNLDQIEFASIRTWALIRYLVPNMKFIGLTDGERRRVLTVAMALGIEALQRWSEIEKTIHTTIIDVADGKLNHDPKILIKLKEVFIENSGDGRVQLGCVTIDHGIQEAFCIINEGRGLTQREEEVLELVAIGKSNAAISANLHITRSTVEFHVSNILRKLDVSSRVEAAVAFWFLKAYGDISRRQGLV